MSYPELPQWENMGNNSERLRVPGGWILRSWTSGSVHQIFISDPTWGVEVMSDLTKPIVLDLATFRSEAERHKTEYETRKNEIRRILDNPYVSSHHPQNIAVLCFEMAASAAKYEQTRVILETIILADTGK